MLVYSLHLVVKNRGAEDPHPNPAAFPASPACHQKLTSPGMSATSSFPLGILRLLPTAFDSSCSNSFTNQQRLPCSRMPQGKIRLSAATQPPAYPGAEHRSPRAPTASGGGKWQLLVGPFITRMRAGTSHVLSRTDTGTGSLGSRWDKSHAPHQGDGTH